MEDRSSLGDAHRLAVRVYYEDTDFTGLVYHASHMRWFERGRSEYLRAAGIDQASLMARPDPCAFAVTRIVIDYLAAARIDDALVVHTRFEAAGRARMKARQRLTRDDQTIARAEVDLACIDLAGRPRRPPAGLVALLAPP
ncbi:MAG: YbgC/FadM family acyl-CoA thioesterase [Caulobacteraceae bacterium]|nr:YbgC/FadM family acyl-CoA thioesterase [Caulobacteraceae bacterium]